MLEKEFKDAIGKVAPERRINLLMPVIAVIFLTGFIIRLIYLSRDDDRTTRKLLEVRCAEEKRDLQNRVYLLQYKNDSMILQSYKDKEQTIAQLRDFLQRSEQQKKQLRR